MHPCHMFLSRKAMHFDEINPAKSHCNDPAQGAGSGFFAVAGCQHGRVCHTLRSTGRPVQCVTGRATAHGGNSCRPTRCDGCSTKLVWPVFFLVAGCAWRQLRHLGAHRYAGGSRTAECQPQYTLSDPGFHAGHFTHRHPHRALFLDTRTFGCHQLAAHHAGLCVFCLAGVLAGLYCHLHLDTRFRFLPAFLLGPECSPYLALHAGAGTGAGSGQWHHQ